MNKNDVIDRNNNQSLKKKINKIWIISMIILLLLTIAGIIFVYVKLNDKNRNPNKINDYEISEIIKKNYIDGFKDISNDGEFTFSLPKEDVNELLSKSVKKLNNKRIESIYYDVGEDNHYYFYVDLKKTGIKTRVVIDTLLEVDTLNKCYYFAIQDCTMGKTPAFSFLSKKGYFSQEFFSKIADYSNLPVSYLEEYNRIKYEPIKYMDQFPYGDVASLMFDFVKEVPNVISLDSSKIGFKVDFTKFRNDDYSLETEVTEVVDVYQRVKDALESINYTSLPIGIPYVVMSLNEKEFTTIINDSFLEVKDEEVTSILTINKANFSISRMAIKILDSVTLKYVFDVSVNGYVCNINQNVTIVNDIYDFETHFYSSLEIESGDIKFTGSNNKQVAQILNIEDNIFNRVKLKQPNAFNFDSLASRFDIELNGLSDELSDVKLRTSPKEISIDAINKCLNFEITRLL